MRLGKPVTAPATVSGNPPEQTTVLRHGKVAGRTREAAHESGDRPESLHSLNVAEGDRKAMYVRLNSFSLIGIHARQSLCIVVGAQSAGVVT